MTESASAAVEFGASEAASFECRLDGGDRAACASPGEYAGLGDGEHTFQALATDRAGSVGPGAAYTWTIDTVAPVTTIEDAPVSPRRTGRPASSSAPMRRAPSSVG